MSGRLSCCGAPATPEGYHRPGCEDAAQYAADLEREEREAWETDRLCDPVEVAS